MGDISNRQDDIGDETSEGETSARRDFLRQCGKFAVVVPPAMALLLTRDANAGVICTSTITRDCVDD